MLLRRHRAERVNRQTTAANVSPSDAPDAGKYDGMSKGELVDEAERRGLAKSGSKATLAERLLEHDAAQAQPGTDEQGPTSTDDVAPDATDAPGDPEGDTDDDEGDAIADAEAVSKGGDDGIEDHDDAEAAALEAAQDPEDDGK